MKSLLPFLFSIAACATVSGQITLQGKVVKQRTGKPVAFGSVYVDGSTIEMHTDSVGRFELHPVMLPATIIVSHLSYEPTAVSFEKSATDIIIQVMDRATQLDEVVIKQPDTWKSDLMRFHKNFLGEDYWGTHARLLNDSVLNFISNNRDLHAETYGPLIVDLPKLGYQVSVDLTQFDLAYNMKYRALEVSYLGHYFFSPYANDDNGKYEEDRQQAYLNSSQHFLKALYDKNLEGQGYRIYEKVYDTATSKEVFRYLDLTSAMKYEDGNLIIEGLTGQHFLILYFFDDNLKPVKFKEEKAKRYKQSVIYFLSDTCLVRSNGTIPDNSILFEGEIGNKKVGAMLPDNYQPQMK